MKVAIATDTNSSMNRKDARKNGVYLLPMPVIVDGTVYLEGIDITNAQRLSVHAIDENLAVDALKKAVGFYEYFIRQFN